MSAAARSRLPDILVPRSGYHHHDEGSCVVCQTHPMAGDPSWPKLHPVGRHPQRSPLSFAAPPIELRLEPLPDFRDLTALQNDLRYDILVGHKPAYAFMPTTGMAVAVGWQPKGMGNIFDDIFGFIASIVEAILGYIKAIIDTIILLFTNPLAAIKKIFQFFIDVFTGKVFLDFLSSFPLTRWLYLGIDHLTGGFLENLRTLTSLPGRFLTGQPIPRSDLIKALGVIVVIAAFALAWVTGGSTLAIIGLSATLLKAGPLGKTALGRTLLDICAIGAGGIASGANLVEVFADAGLKWLEKQAIGEFAKKIGVSSFVVGAAVTGVTAIASSAGSSDEGEDTEGEGDSSTETDTAETPAPAAPSEGAPSNETPETPGTPEAAPASESSEASEATDSSGDTSETPDTPDTSVDTDAIMAIAKAAAVTQTLLVQAEKKDNAAQIAAAHAAKAQSAAAIKQARVTAQNSCVAHAKAAISAASSAIQAAKAAKTAKNSKTAVIAAKQAIQSSKDASVAAAAAQEAAKTAHTTAASNAAAKAAQAAQTALKAAKAAVAYAKRFKKSHSRRAV